MPKVIKMSLSVNSINKAIKELQKYKQDLNRKSEELCRRLNEEGIKIAQLHIGSSGFGKYIQFESEVTPTEAGCKAIFYMSDASPIISQWKTKEGIKSAEVSPSLMIEFGSGLKAENPAEVPGVGTGTFPGETHGADPGGWWYMDLDGVWHHSTGVAPQMPMYYAGQELRDKIAEIAREVFK